MVKNNVSINVVKVRIKTEYGRIPPKSVSDTGKPYYVACLIETSPKLMQLARGRILRE